jgi:hypothetical protein
MQPEKLPEAFMGQTGSEQTRRQIVSSSVAWPERMQQKLDALRGAMETMVPFLSIIKEGGLCKEYLFS